MAESRVRVDDQTAEAEDLLCTNHLGVTSREEVARLKWCCNLVASALCLSKLKHQGAERRTTPGLSSPQTAVCTASADLSLCADVGQAKLAATIDVDSTLNHKQLAKASRQDTSIFRVTIMIKKKV